MIHRAATACWRNVCFILVAVLLPGCASRSVVDRIQEDARDEVQAVISMPGAEPLVTVICGPEWQTLDIIDRRIIDGTLRCVVYNDIAFDMSNALTEGITWYETKDAETVETFRRLRGQLARGEEVCGAPLLSSNTVIRMHLLDESGNGVLLEDPWSIRGVHWLADQTILLNAALDESSDGCRSGIQEWVDPVETASFDVSNRLFEFPATETYYMSVFLEYFDLHQRLAWTLGQSSSSSSDMSSAMEAESDH